MKIFAKEILSPDYVRYEVAPGLVDYRKDVGVRARFQANLFATLGLVLVAVVVTITYLKYDENIYEQYALLGFIIATFAISYKIYRYQARLRRGIAPNLVSIDSDSQILTAGIGDDKVQFHFDEVQDILVNSKKHYNGNTGMLPTSCSYSIVLWTTDDVYFPLMEPLWQTDVRICTEHEQKARDIANDVRDIIRHSLIMSKAQHTTIEPAILVEEY